MKLTQLTKLTKLSRLSQREKVSVIIGAAALILSFIYGVIINPIIGRSEKLNRQIAQKKDEMSEMQKLKKIYLAQKEAISKINKKLSSEKKGFAILSFLEEMAGKVGIKGNIVKMKPFDSTVGDHYKESSVELKVDGITLNQLVDYLYNIENAEKVLNIKRLKLKTKPKKPQMMDVTFEVVTFELLN